MTRRGRILLNICLFLIVLDIGLLWSRAHRVQYGGWNKKDMSFLDERIQASVHEQGYENAWVQDLDKKEGLVLVTTVESGISVVFKPTSENFDKFHIGWISPVTFVCSGFIKEKCDFNSPLKVFVGNSEVEVKYIKHPEA